MHSRTPFKNIAILSSPCHHISTPCLEDTPTLYLYCLNQLVLLMIPGALTGPSCTSTEPAYIEYKISDYNNHSRLHYTVFILGGFSVGFYISWHP